MTKSVCTGTRAIVKTLPSGRISEEVWELVDSHGSRRPSRREVWPILRRLVGGEEFRVSREMLRLVRVELHLVRGAPLLTDETNSDFRNTNAVLKFAQPVLYKNTCRI